MISRSDTNRNPAAAHPFDILAIVFVTLWLATASVAFAYYTKWNGAEVKWKTATVDAVQRSTFRSEQETVIDLHNDNETLKADLRKLSYVTGYYAGDEAVSSLEPMAATLNGLNEELKAGLTAIDPNAGQQSNILTMRSAIKRLESRVADLLGNETEGTNALEKELAVLRGALKDLTAGGALSEEREKEAVALRKLQQDLDSALSKSKDKRLETINLRKTMEGQRHDERKKVENSQNQKHLLDTKLFKTKELYKGKISELRTTLQSITKGIKDLRDLIEENPKDPDPKQPDGEILDSSTDNGICYVDLTRGDRLLRGMIFEVFRYRKGGRETPRGKIQILTVADKMSKARILERYYQPESGKGRVYKMASQADIPDHVLREFKIDPLGEGDMVRNPVFNKTKKRVFVFAGKLTSTYKGEEAKRLIEELGDQVQPHVTERTDFVVLGLGYEKDPDFKKSQELGIPKMSERELLQVLGKD